MTVEEAKAAIRTAAKEARIRIRIDEAQTVPGVPDAVSLRISLVKRYHAERDQDREDTDIANFEESLSEEWDFNEQGPIDDGRIVIEIFAR